MPVDKFGRMSDTKTKDTGVSLTYINNNYIRSDGGTPISGSLDMRGNTIYNVADPVNPQDVVTKVYVDNTKGSGVIGRKIGDAVSIKENLDFMGKQKIKNLVDPVNDKDAVTKEYVDTTTVPFLKLDQTKYNTKGDIDMGGSYTVYNVKNPIDDSHIVDKKYVDEMDNLKSAFSLKSGDYEAKGAIFMKKHKLGGLREPTQDGEASTKKYVDDLVSNHCVDENDNIAFGRDVDMEGNKIFSLPEPEQDSDPATKKYVDDLQNQYIDKRGNIKFGRNINLENKRIFALKDPKKDYEATNKKYVDDSITKRLQEEKDKFLPQDPATKQYVDEAIRGIAGGDVLVSKEGVFIKENGHYRATAPLDIDNQKMENLPDPVDEKDAVNKKYIDGIVEILTLKQGLVRENGGFNLVDSYINMNFNNIRNVGYPKHTEDAVPRSFVDDMVKTIEEKVEKVKEKIKESPFFKENGNYQALSSINMCFNKLLNLRKPTEPHEVTTKEYVDVYFDETKENVENYKTETKKEVEEFIDTVKQDIEQFKEVTRQQLNINEDIIQTRLLKFKQIITVSAEFRGSLNTNNLYFSFFIHSSHSNECFTIPLEGRLLKIKTHTKRYVIDFLEGNNFGSTPVGFDIENENLEFSLRVDDEEKFLISNPNQGSTTTILINPILLQPDDEIKLLCLSKVPIRIIGFIVLVIELNV